MVEAVQRFDERALTVKIHATGNGSTRLALDAIQAARGNSDKRIKHEIAHCNGVHPGKPFYFPYNYSTGLTRIDDFARFAAQNVTAELSPAIFFDHPVTSASNGAINWDFTTFLNTRTHPITVGSDWGSRGDPCLLPTVHHVARRVGEWAIVQDSSISEIKEEAGARKVLEILTKNGAEAVGLDAVSGSIEVGKRANFIMLDRDVVGDEQNVADFANVQVLKTWFEGELVWDAEMD